MECIRVAETELGRCIYGARTIFTLAAIRILSSIEPCNATCWLQASSFGGTYMAVSSSRGGAGNPARCNMMDGSPANAFARRDLGSKLMTASGALLAAAGIAAPATAAEAK
jgi:hypothetical protein